MKYPKKTYLKAASKYFGYPPEQGVEHEHIKMVTCRKDHKCDGGCKRIIYKGERAITNTAIHTYEGGWKSEYICEICMDGFINKDPELRLKPCPFCGGTDIHIIRTECGKSAKIECYDCLASFFQMEACCEDDLADAWNRRPKRTEEMQS